MIFTGGSWWYGYLVIIEFFFFLISFFFPLIRQLVSYIYNSEQPNVVTQYNKMATCEIIRRLCMTMFTFSIRCTTSYRWDNLILLFLFFTMLSLHSLCLSVCVCITYFPLILRYQLVDGYFMIFNCLAYHVKVLLPLFLFLSLCCLFVGNENKEFSFPFLLEEEDLLLARDKRYERKVKRQIKKERRKCS